MIKKHGATVYWATRLFVFFVGYKILGHLGFTHIQDVKIVPLLIWDSLAQQMSFGQLKQSSYNKWTFIVILAPLRWGLGWAPFRQLGFCLRRTLWKQAGAERARERTWTKVLWKVQKNKANSRVGASRSGSKSGRTWRAAQRGQKPQCYLKCV